MTTASPITVETTVNAPIEKVWDAWNNPEDIKQWCVGSPDWHTPSASVELKEGGTFTTRMEAKDGSMGFDMSGTYTTVSEHKEIAYTMGDGRKVRITFEDQGGTVHIVETFDAESENPPEMQRQGWQGILDNFKKHVESL